MSATARPEIAFFGATGACTQSALVHALRAGHHAIALARTPDKLTTQLKEQGISQETLEMQLTIITGSSLDKTAVRKVLTGGGQPNYLVRHIVSGLGGAPTIKINWFQPLNPVSIHVDQPSICADSAKTLLTALSEIYETSPELKTTKPHLTCISTTGISRGIEDVPWGMQTLYHRVLAEPHRDKKIMEDMFRDNVDGKDGRPSSLVVDLIVVRPTLLKGGNSVDRDCVGLDRIRAGTEDKPATGFSIYRADVGHWIFVNALDNEKRKVWANHMVSLTS